MQAMGFRTSGLAGVLMILACGAVLTFGQVPPPPPVASVSGDDAEAPGVDVLTRGPIHEAFAQPINAGGMKLLVVPNKPPEPIDEIPSSVKPVDPSAIWIGGYWSWADDCKDFIWVSGVWRVPPPNMQWIPGYWAQVGGGYQWASGFWSPAAQPQATYYPAPPATQERGPTSDPPTAHCCWVSGCWRWRGGRFAWQGGYWAPAQDDCLWVSASYYWCPRGWVFCDGYWDYPLAARGLMFAPCRFRHGLQLQAGFVFCPTVCIDCGLLTLNLFVRPGYCHYYFGDYYGVEYDWLGIYPWFDMGQYPDFAYDPLFTYYRSYHRDRDPQWQANLKGWHHYYRSHPDERPPHDMAAQFRLVAEGGTRPDKDFLTIGLTVDALRNNPQGSIKVVDLSAAEQARFHETARSTRQLETERSRLESQAAGGHGKGPHSLALPRVSQGMAAARAGDPGGGAVVKNSTHGRSFADVMKPPKIDSSLRHLERMLLPPPHYGGGSGSGSGRDSSGGGSERGSDRTEHDHQK